eukprot:131804_1
MADTAQITCRYGRYCRAVKIGECKYKHRTCMGGRSCSYLARRACSFYHPIDHFQNANQNDENLDNENKEESDDALNNCAIMNALLSNDLSVAIDSSGRLFDYQQHLLRTGISVLGDSIVDEDETSLGQLFVFLSMQIGIQTVFEKLQNKINHQELEIGNLKDKIMELEIENKYIQQKELNELSSNTVQDLYKRKVTAQNHILRIDKIIKKRHEDAATCIACCDHKKNILFEPCHHLVLCDQCHNKIENNLCPLCQKEIHHIIKVFH